MHSISNAVLQFALITIAVKVYPVASPQQVSFNWITKKGNRTKQKLLDAETQEEVHRSDLQYGFEVEKDKFVFFSQEELTLIKKHRVSGDYIEICKVVKRQEISLKLVEKSFYLSPNKSDRAYRLLYQALLASKRMIVAKWYRSNKDNLVVIVSEDNILMMYQLYYPNEVRDMDVAFTEDSVPNPEEVKLAKRVLDQLPQGIFDLSEYKDEYQNRLLAAVEEKKSGATIYSQSQIENGQKLLDLMSQLKESLKKK